MATYNSSQCKIFRDTHDFRVKKKIDEDNIRDEKFNPDKFEGVFLRGDKYGSSQFCNCGKQLCAICGCCTCGTAPVVCVHSDYIIQTQVQSDYHITEES